MGTTQLAKRLAELDRSAAWLARRLDPPVDRSTAWRWAQGTVEIPEDRRDEVAKLLGMKPAALAAK